jgi:tRNA/tmRNA/rRNA uracil-C5-methylase (TrmA/RlmC/RlmD family)
MNDKKHWYDGLIYDKFIAPNQDKLFSEIKKIIEPNSNVLDVGCGTGRLALQNANHFNSITGIDLSSKNIKVANTNLEKTNIKNVKFIHGTAIDLKNTINEKFDYAVITYVIHEMPPKDRIKTLKEMKEVADKIIIGDYITPTPNTFWGKLNVVVEYLAGTDHYNNFKLFVKSGGLNSLIKETGLELVKEVKNKPQTAHLVVVK